MIRVVKDKCGYSGYDCVGAPDLDDAFKVGKLVCDTELERTSNFEVYKSDGTEEIIDFSYIDNYYNLPERIKGFVMVVDTLLNMYLRDSPESACRNNVNPFETGGVFLNLYETRYSGIVTWRYDSDAYTLASSTLLCAQNVSDDGQGVPRTLYPPILEPVLDTEFPPITFDGPPDTDPKFDSIMLIIAYLIRWRKVIEQKINYILKQINYIAGIRIALKSMAEHDTTQCECFAIYKRSGEASGTGSPKNATYWVDGCTIDLNGNSVSFDSEYFTAPFYAYGVIELEYDEDGGCIVRDSYITDQRISASATTIVFGIGGVYLVPENRSTHSKYDTWMYVVEQDNCLPHLEAVRAESAGFMFYTGSGEVPYMTYEYEECPETGDEYNYDDGL